MLVQHHLHPVIQKDLPLFNPGSSLSILGSYTIWWHQDVAFRFYWKDFVSPVFISLLGNIRQSTSSAGHVSARPVCGVLPYSELPGGFMKYRCKDRWDNPISHFTSIRSFHSRVRYCWIWPCFLALLYSLEFEYSSVMQCLPERSLGLQSLLTHRKPTSDAERRFSRGFPRSRQTPPGWTFVFSLKYLLSVTICWRPRTEPTLLLNTNKFTKWPNPYPADLFRNHSNV